MEPDFSDLITLTEAAKRAGVARDTIHRAAKTGKLKAVQLGRDWFIYHSDLERWKRDHYQPDKAFRYPIPKEEDSDNKPD